MGVCQTQEQPYRGPFTQPRLHFWRKRVVSSQRQRIVTGSSSQAYHEQSLGIVEDHHLVQLGT